MTLANSRNEIIIAAAGKIGVKAAGEPMSAEDQQTMAKTLDVMVKSWQGRGAKLWARKSFTLFLQPAQIEYQFGGTNTDEATESYTETTLSSAAAADDTTLSLTSSTGLAIADRIGIKLDDGTVQWTTIKIAVSITLDDAITSAAASGNAVYFYTTKIGKILRVPDARRVQGTGSNTSEIDMFSMGRDGYLQLPNKLTSGTPVQFYYEPQISSGLMHVWPAPTVTDTFINCTGYFPLEVFSDSDDTPDFPDEWLRALIFNLAVESAPDFGGARVTPETAAIAVSSYEDALDWDQDDASIFLQYGL